MYRKFLTLLLVLGLILCGCAPVEETPDTVPTVTEPVFDTTGLPTIQPTVLYNKNSITLTAHEFGKLGEDYAVSVILTNDTDQSIGVSTRSLSVNGVMLTASGLECSANAGQKAEAYLILDSIELLSAGIETVAELEFYLQFYALGEDNLASSDMLVLQTSAADQTVEPASDDGIEVYNENGIRIVYQGFTVDANDDGYANFYLENNTELTLTFTSGETRVNGAAMDSYLWTEVRPGKKALGGVCFHDIGTKGITGDEEIVTLNVSLSAMDTEAMEQYLAIPEIYLRFSGE